MKRRVYRKVFVDKEFGCAASNGTFDASLPLEPLASTYIRRGVVAASLPVLPHRDSIVGSDRRTVIKN